MFNKLLIFLFLLLISPKITIASEDEAGSPPCSPVSSEGSSESSEGASESSEGSSELEFDVGVRRDLGEIRSAGIYFSKDATLKHHLEDDDYDDVNMGISSPLSTRLDHLDHFLVKQGIWNRNHVSASVFVLVYDTRDETSKLLEGSILAQWDAGLGVYDFMVRPSVHGPVDDYKCADFVSSAIPPTAMVGLGADKDSYTFIDENTLKPIGDKDKHGDRLALDTISMNPDLLFSLVRRTAHREDLKISGMGVRYLSTYDACDNCFKKIHDTHAAMQEKLKGVATSQGYKIYGEDGDLSYYNLFYSGRPGTHPATVPTTYTGFYQFPEDGKRWKLSEKASYEGASPDYSYYLNFTSASAAHKGRLNRRASKEVVLRGGDIFLEPSKVYLNVRKFEPAAGTIEYKLG